MPVRDLLSAASGVFAPNDPNFANVTLLLDGNGTNGAQNNTFLDSSTNNFTITRNGNTTQGSFSPYGSNWSNYFNGSSYLTPSSSFTNLGTSAYTIEFWIFPTTLVADGKHVIAANDTNGLVVVINNAKVSINKFGVGDVLAYNTALSTNTWTHVALVRQGTGSNQTKIYINGSSVATGTDNNNWTVTANTAIGGNSGTNSQYITGYLSNLRIVTSAVYTSTFTPSTTPLTAITNTSLLTCQSNRFIDNSSTARTFTTSGSPSVQRFSPFEPTAPYSTSVIGGSGYFDGSGDDIRTTTNQIIPATSNFTIEGWIYTTNVTGNTVVFSQSSSSNSGRFILYCLDTFQLYLGIGSPFTSITTSGTFNLNTWNHWAVTRNGNTFTLYMNGSSQGTMTSSNSIENTVLTFGNFYSNTQYFVGYQSDNRLVNDLVYSGSTYTIPTAPLTAIANTRLLLSYTNAGIPDLAMQNNLETVGNAQVSTSVKKFGTGSLAFDGSGDSLKIPDSPVFAFGSGNFTIEAWIYPTTTGTYPCIASQFASTDANSSFFFCLGNGNRNLEIFLYSSTSTNISASNAVTLNQWNYVTVVRNGNTVSLYVNGTSVASQSYSSTINNSSRPIYVGNATDDSANYYFTGYIDDLRITNGIARYTANFTPPTQALPTF
jgi:hypothetical protein